MRLTVKLPNRSKVFMTVPDTSTISHIKKCIKDVSNPEEQIEPSKQNIVYNGKILSDTSTLSDYSIKEGGVVKMTLKVRKNYHYVPFDEVKMKQEEYSVLIADISTKTDTKSSKKDDQWTGFGVGLGLARVGTNSTVKFCDNCSSMDMDNYHKCAECASENRFYELCFDCYCDGHGDGVKIHNARHPTHMKWIS